MNKISYTRWLTLLVLVAIFIAPGVVAYEYYTHRAHSMPTTNQGKLIRPPVLLALPFTGSRWRMVLWRPHGCAHACARKLDRLARVRLALGRRLYQVDVVLLLRSDRDLAFWQATNHSLFKRMREYDLSTIIVSKKNQQLLGAFGDHGGVYLVSPQKYLVLAYPDRDFSDAIFHDLKHILSN